MSFADGVILVVVAVIVGLIFWSLFKHKDEDVCARCSYGKACAKNDCLTNKKSHIDE